ncbi:M16 family metallopeptidase [Thiovibrio sp. JS02]
MFEKTVLANGVRVITEKIPSRTVSVGIWVDVGARDEQPANNGSAHFVEHMLFKGTSARNAQQIAQEFDMLGGMSNAFTSNETTSYYATVLDDQLGRVVALLADLFLDSLYLEEEVAREREVILQEISMVEDTPDDRIHELFTGSLWGAHPLGQTVLGSRDVVANMTSARLRAYVRETYTPARLVIAAAGNVKHGEFCRLWQEQLGGLAKAEKAGTGREVPAQLAPVRKIYKKKLEQVHMVLGTYGLPIIAEERYALYLLHILLGGNMSSRLFQEVREKEGLAYSIYSYLSSFTDSGYLGIYLGVDPAMVNKSLAVIAREIRALRSKGTSLALLANAKDYAKAGIFLSAENMETRMTRIARNELTFGRYIPFDEVVAGFDRVGQEDIIQLAGQLFARPFFGAALGPVRGKDIDWQPLDLEAN